MTTASGNFASLVVHKSDVDRLESIAEVLMRAKAEESAVALFALALRFRTEAGWDYEEEPSNVRPLRAV